MSTTCFPVKVTVRGVGSSRVPFFFKRIIRNFLGRPICILLSATVFKALQRQHRTISERVHSFHIVSSILLCPLIMFFLIVTFPFGNVIGANRRLPFSVAQLNRIGFGGASTHHDVDHQSDFFGKLVVTIVLFSLFFSRQ